MGGFGRMRWITVWPVLLAFAVIPALSQTPPLPASPGRLAKLVVSVTDENGVAVPSARVFLQPPVPGSSLRGETDFTGRCQFDRLAPGTYQLRVEKQDFYSLAVPAVNLGATVNLDLTLSHQQEVREVVTVAGSPPAIDPTQISSQEKLSGLDILNIPYPATRDYRNVLNFIPGVVQDTFGQPHIAGAETYQVLTLLDSFNVTQPANGQLLMRVSTDAFRSVEVETSRLPAEYGKESGGILSLNTGIGDDHYRFIATDFTPSLQNKKGIALDSVAPRITFSGPLRRGRVWFFDGMDGEYDNIVVPELPTGADHNDLWRVGNLGKIQANLTSRNILTTSFVVNHLHDPHQGLSPQTPREATASDVESAYLGTVKDQHYFSGGELLETGLAFTKYNLAQTPLGTAPYFLTPETAIGNFYFTARTHASRWQALANLYLPARQWHGRHQFKVGVDLDRLKYDAAFTRQPISFLIKTPPTTPPPQDFCSGMPSPCSRFSTFTGGAASATYNSETSGYAQDQWLLTERLLIEPGVRLDWDEIVRRALVSPRLAGTYVLDREGNTKLSAGAGMVHESTPLVLIARPFAGQRLDQFFDTQGNPINPPVPTTFFVNRQTLQAPRFLNWSFGVEKKLPRATYLKAEFVERRGIHGFVYNAPVCSLACDFGLQNTREDRYDAFQFSLRHNFHERYALMGAYTRSRTHSNQVLDFNVDNPTLSPQAAGPYPWDTPSRFLSWGYLPFFRLPIIHRLDLAYSAEARSGFAFSAVNSRQQIQGNPDSYRFPTYFSLNVHLEKRFHLFGAFWAVRGGLDNLTDHRNPLFVNNNVDAGPRRSHLQRFCRPRGHHAHPVPRPEIGSGHSIVTRYSESFALPAASQRCGGN